MNPLYRRLQEWSTYRLHQPIGATQTEENLHHLLLKLWSRSKQGWLHRLTKGQPYLCFEVQSDAGQVEHHWHVPRGLGPFTQELFADAYRPGELEQAETAILPLSRNVAGALLQLGKPVCFGLAVYRAGFGRELAGALAGLQQSESATLQILLIPLHDSEWKPAAHREFRRAAQLEADGSTVTSVGARWADSVFEPVDEFLGLGKQGHALMRRDTADAVERSMVKETPAKMRDHAFEVITRVVASSPTRSRSLSLVRGISAHFASLDDANQVIPRRVWLPQRFGRLVQERWPTGQGDVWTCAELASLVSVPGPVPSDDVGKVMEIRHKPPAGELTIGYGVYRGQRLPVQINTADLCRHMVIQGQTGSGKGVLQLHLCKELARAGHGFTWLFPLRKDAYTLLAALPEERMADVIFFEVGHPRFSLPLNLLAHNGSEEDKARVERDTMGLFWRLWSDSWGKSMERLLRASVIGAAAIGGHLGTAEKILTSEETRRRAALQVRNESVRAFLMSFDGGNVDSAVNKLQELLWQEPIAAMVGQAHALPWREIISGRKIVIGSLNAELMGDLAANLAAGGIVSQLQRAAMSIAPGQRTFHALGIDEFRNVAGRARDNWETGFSQLRQFQLGLIPAGQYPAQLPEAVWNSISGNVGSKIILRQEGDHARDCLKVLGPGVTPDDLQALPTLKGYANLLIDGKPTGPFTLYAPRFLTPVRDGYQAAEDSMSRWLKPRRESPKPKGAPVALEVD